MNDKIREKIEKLLQLSMSDNENEAKLALSKALELMEAHNITEDEVYRQNFTQKIINLDVKRVPDWLSSLYDSMARVSGCMFTWQNGNFGKAKAFINGRERDVENAAYLVSFLQREVEKLAKQFKKEHKHLYIGTDMARAIKSYKKGLISIVYKRLEEEKNTFFNKQTTGTDLVCVDTKSRYNDAKNWFTHEHGKCNTVTSAAKYDTSSMAAGYRDGENIQINQAVTGQDNVKMIGV